MTALPAHAAARVGVVISKRQVVRLLNAGKQSFLEEARGVLRAGLTNAAWITADDTGARHKAKNGFCTQIGNTDFTWFGTTGSKKPPQLPRALARRTRGASGFSRSADGSAGSALILSRRGVAGRSSRREVDLTQEASDRLAGFTFVAVNDEHPTRGSPLLGQQNGRHEWIVVLGNLLLKPFDSLPEQRDRSSSKLFKVTPYFMRRGAARSTETSHSDGEVSRPSRL